MFPHVWKNRRSGHDGLIRDKMFDKPIFRLNFPRDQLIGHSDFRIPKNDAKFVTPNLVSSEIEMKPIYNVSETNQMMTCKADYVNPRILYHSPLLTSESYGWWHDDTFSGRDAKFDKEHDEKSRDLHRWSPLSSESYGWWYDRGFGSRDTRFHHHHRDPELARSNEIIHWQDQKLSGLCHPSYAGYS